MNKLRQLIFFHYLTDQNYDYEQTLFLRMALMLFISILSLQAQAQNNKNKQQGSKKSGVYKAPAVTGTVYNADTAFAAPTPKKGRPKKTSPVSRK